MAEEKIKNDLKEKTAEEETKIEKKNAEENHQEEVEKQEIKDDEKSKEEKDIKKEEKIKKQIVKKDYATVNGLNLHISAKTSIHVCDMIRGRSIDTALKMLEEVSKYKRVVKMNNREVGHRHGKGIMAGRYPLNAVIEFIDLVKRLKANALYHGVEIEKCVISCKANKAPRPFKRGGARAKRAHIFLKLEKMKQNMRANKKDSKNKQKVKKA